MMLGSSTDKDPIVFDSRFMPMFLALLAVVVVLTLSIGLLRDGSLFVLKLAYSDYFLFLLAFIAALMLYVLLLNAISAVKVYDNGLSAVTLILDRHFRHWHQLYGARVHNFMGLKVLFLDADGLKRPLIVPLFMHGLDVFIELACEHVGEDSELATILRNV